MLLSAMAALPAMAQAPAPVEAPAAERPLRAGAPEALTRALAAVARRDWAAAAAAAEPAGQVGADIVTWHRLRAGEGSFVDYAGFIARRPDWPGMPFLLRRGEAKLEGVAATDVVAYFAGRTPQTGAGALALVAALEVTGDAEAAATVAGQAWRSLVLDAGDEAAFLADHAALVEPHHGGRMQAMLDRGEIAQAQRMLDHVSPGTRAVAVARIALQQGTPGVDTLIAAVPEHMANSEGLARDRAAWRLRNGFSDTAAELILERSAAAEGLEAPELWARSRILLARQHLRDGDFARMRAIAAPHGLSSGASFADLEWLAGYAALKIGDAAAAHGHFARLRDGVGTPISLSRAGYWQGRAAEAMGDEAGAAEAYGFAAGYQTAFYGLLAAERAGLPMDPALAAGAALPDWRGGSFAGSGVFQAAVLLRAAGDITLAERFLLHLAESLGPEDHARLASLALDWGDAHLALLMAKAAANHGAVLPVAYFPLPGLEEAELGVPPELVLSIARRESEFDPAAVSHAGARGLMQVMPDTARMMAARLSLPYELSRLTADPDYNARLGAEYLSVLRDEFGPSPVLVAAGYNAGPGRPRSWMADRGDPRDPAVDVIDWIEMIPFAETRNYVMRVAESLPVYRARLAGAPVEIRLSEELRGR